MSDQKVLILGGRQYPVDGRRLRRAAAYLEEHYRWPDNVTSMDGGTQGLMLMSELMDCDFLVVLDVVLGPKEPGTIYRLEGENLRQSLSFRDSMHQTDLLGHPGDLRTGGPSPRRRGLWHSASRLQKYGLELTAEIQAKLPEF